MNIFPKIYPFSATATAQKTVRNNDKRKGLLIVNNEATNLVELVDSKNAQYGQGIPIKPKGHYVNNDYCQGAYYLICDTGKTADVRIEEDIEIA